MTTPAERYAAFRERHVEPQFAAFQALYDFDFDAFQIAACEALGQGNGVLVAAPTGSGKTVIGEFAVHLALAQGRKCFYTTPIKALSNQKYGDLVRRYDSSTVGLLTGDNSINGDAPVVVMTTEVLRNMLYAGSLTLDGLGYVVLDEVHYLADRSRGAVWEEVIIHLPESVQVVALSATVSNAEEFGDWLDQVRGGTAVIVDEHRPVPLWQHMLVGRRLLDLFTEPAQPGDPAQRGRQAQREPPAKAEVNPELLRLAQRDQWSGQGSGGRGRDAGYARRIRNGGRPAPRAGQRPGRFSGPYRPEVIERLDAAGLLPAITFIFSRAGCDAAVQQCLNAGLRLTSPDEAQAIGELVERRTADIPEGDLAVLGYPEWLAGLRRGIAAHHAGMLPAFKEIVEELFAAGLVRAVFATETLALGINMPARTVVIERLDKWNGETHADLTPGEYTQLTGRAGRRGIDVEGHAVVVWHPGMDPEAVAGLAGTRTYPLNSSFRPSYNMAVNLTGQVGRAKAATLLESSFAQFQADRGVVGLARQVRKGHEAMADLARKMTCDQGDFPEYAEIRRDLSEREGDLSRQRATSRRAEAARSLGLLRRGDIIRVPGGRRAGVAVVLDPGPAPYGRPERNAKAPAAGSGKRGAHAPQAARPSDAPDPGSPMPRGAMAGVGPLVLTASRQVKQLSVADFPVPVEAIDQVRIPAHFSARSPQHRRDLAASMRSKLAGRDLGGPPRAPDWRGNTVLAQEGEIAALRKRLRRHPCHACPDREEHARYAERYLRMQRETETLERKVASRSHVIARTFDRVCAVLDQLGYLDGDAVTPAGRRLASLYSELDLLAAECLSQGYWDGLSAPELAACVSALTFESRQADDAQPPRLPKGPVRETLAAMARTWGDLDQLEKDNGVSFLREPDLGFAWPAYQWAGGKRLEDVLESAPTLTPGDFVRCVKQLIDLLDQIAGAADDPDISATAHTAITAMRRGVIAYSTVAD